MIVVALVTGLAVWRVRQPPMISRPLVRFSIDLLGTPPPLTLARNPIAISPDGSRVVYVANQRLNVRALDQLEATPLAGSESPNPATFARTPCFSPDGHWIGF